MRQVIQYFNEWLSRQGYDELPVGLFVGQMGLCIYWYQQSRIYKNSKYEQLASELLDKVFQNINKNPCCDLENGILGIGFGVLYLLDNKYISGTANNILFELDEKIFQQLYFGNIMKNRKSSQELFTLTWGLLYLCRRLRYDILEQSDGFLYYELLKKGVNSLEMGLRDIPLREPNRFSLCYYYTPVLIRLITELYKQNIYIDKVYMLCRGLLEKLYSVTPFFMGNRIVLCSEIELLMTSLSDQNLKEKYGMYRNMLLQGIDVPKFLLQELGDKQLSIDNGVAGILFYFGKVKHSSKYEVDSDCILRRVFDSSLWKDWEKHSFGCEHQLINFSMYYGLPGVIFSCQLGVNQ